MFIIFSTNLRRMLKIFFLARSAGSYQENIRVDIEINPTKFLYTTFNCIDGIYCTMVHQKTTKLPINWLSNYQNVTKPMQFLTIFPQEKIKSEDFDSKLLIQVGEVDNFLS